MKSISKKRIIEKYLVREKAVKYAKKYGFAEAGRKYNYSRQVLHQWLKKYDGTYQSLMPKSRRPNYHPNQHTNEELNMIKAKYGRFKTYGLAHVYAKLRKDGYKRSFCSFKRQLKKHQIQEKLMRKYIKKDRYTKLKATFPGEYIEIDVKYVPKGCIGFDTNVERYYQITAIDLYSRKRVLKIVKEHSTYETAIFATLLEKEFGFKIKTVQTDNGFEFVNNSTNTNKKTMFSLVLQKLGIRHITTRPYSPWQNGVVERSHKEDGLRFYNKEFKTEKQLYKGIKRYNTIYNNTCKQVLDFKSPNEVIEQYNKMAMNI